MKISLSGFFEGASFCSDMVSCVYFLRFWCCLFWKGVSWEGRGEDGMSEGGGWIPCCDFDKVGC